MFLGSARGRSSVPACAHPPRRAQRWSRLARGHRRRRRGAVLTSASTAPGSIRSGTVAAKCHITANPLWRGLAHPPVGFPLLTGRKSHQNQT